MGRIKCRERGKTDDKRDLFRIYFRIKHYEMEKKILRTYQNNLFPVFYLDDVIISPIHKGTTYEMRDRNITIR